MRGIHWWPAVFLTRVQWCGKGFHTIDAITWFLQQPNMKYSIHVRSIYIAIYTSKLQVFQAKTNRCSTQKRSSRESVWSYGGAVCIIIPSYIDAWRVSQAGVTRRYKTGFWYQRRLIWSPYNELVVAKQMKQIIYLKRRIPDINISYLIQTRRWVCLYLISCRSQTDSFIIEEQDIREMSLA